MIHFASILYRGTLKIIYKCFNFALTSCAESYSNLAMLLEIIWNAPSNVHAYYSYNNGYHQSSSSIIHHCPTTHFIASTTRLASSTTDSRRCPVNDIASSSSSTSSKLPSPMPSNMALILISLLAKIV